MAQELYISDSKIVFLVFRLIIGWLSKSQHIPNNVGCGEVLSTVILDDLEEDLVYVLCNEFFLSQVPHTFLVLKDIMEQ
jgi:hypothetical protein